MHATQRLPVCLLAALVALAASGCFKSLTLQASSGSSSDFSSSPFKSSSGSSSPEEQAAEDVRDATELWVIQGGDLAALRRDVGRVTREYGLSDWERHPEVYRAIGRGLQRSSLEETRVASVVDALCAGAPEAVAWVEAGYHTDRVN